MFIVSASLSKALTRYSTSGLDLRRGSLRATLRGAFVLPTIIAVIQAEASIIDGNTRITYQFHELRIMAQIQIRKAIIRTVKSPQRYTVAYINFCQFILRALQKGQLRATAHI